MASDAPGVDERGDVPIPGDRRTERIVRGAGSCEQEDGGDRDCGRRPITTSAHRGCHGCRHVACTGSNRVSYSSLPAAALTGAGDCTGLNRIPVYCISSQV